MIGIDLSDKVVAFGIEIGTAITSWIGGDFSYARWKTGGKDTLRRYRNYSNDPYVNKWEANGSTFNLGWKLGNKQKTPLYIAAGFLYHEVVIENQWEGMDRGESEITHASFGQVEMSLGGYFYSHKNLHLGAELNLHTKIAAREEDYFAGQVAKRLNQESVTTNISYRF